MSKEIDPNALAWKGTPGPWQVKLNEKMISIHTGNTDEDVNGIDPTICGIWAHQYEDERRPGSEANAHLISAAPEAIEFMADLMPELDLMKASGLFDSIEVDKWISRAEEILKKAYNH